jgi:ACT domain-containing protein
MAKSNKIQHTKKALIEALEKSLGIITTACKIVGIDRTTFYRYLKEDKDFAKEVKEIENVTLDFVESQLHKQIQENSTAATIFFLKTKGKSRGYIEKIEQDINLTTDIPIIKWVEQAAEGE